MLAGSLHFYIQDGDMLCLDFEPLCSHSCAWVQEMCKLCLVVMIEAYSDSACYQFGNFARNSKIPNRAHFLQQLESLVRICCSPSAIPFFERAASLEICFRIDDGIVKQEELLCVLRANRNGGQKD